MKQPMTHERCSELLLPYRRGELSGALAEQVAEHLAGCRGCSLEAEGLGALLSAPLPVQLDDLERQRLRANIREALTERGEEGAPAEGWRQHAAPLLGAAALLALVAVGLLMWPGLRSSSELPAAGVDNSAESQEGTSLGDQDVRQDKEAQDAAGGAPQTESLEVRGREAPKADAAKGSAAGAGGDTTTGEVAGTLAFGAAPVVIDQPYSTARFEPSSLLPPRFPRIGASQAGYVQRLTRNVGDAAVVALIRMCTESLRGSGPPEWLPTMATYYRPDDILVIGFVRPVRASRILEYELRGWHRDCDHPAPIYRTGRLS